jgi:hypothetical protein
MTVGFPGVYLGALLAVRIPILQRQLCVGDPQLLPVVDIALVVEGTLAKIMNTRHYHHSPWPISQTVADEMVPLLGPKRRRGSSLLLSKASLKSFCKTNPDTC